MVQAIESEPTDEAMFEESCVLAGVEPPGLPDAEPDPEDYDDTDEPSVPFRLFCFSVHLIEFLLSLSFCSQFFAAVNVCRSYLLQRGMQDEYSQLGNVLTAAQINSVSQSHQVSLDYFFYSAPALSSSAVSSSSSSPSSFGKRKREYLDEDEVSISSDSVLSENR